MTVKIYFLICFYKSSIIYFNTQQITQKSTQEKKKRKRNSLQNS